MRSTTLIDELWDQTPPKSALNTLQTYVVHLRKKFSEQLRVPADVVSKELLQTVRGGYRFNVGSASFDLREYRRLAALGGSALSTRDMDAAARHFGAALGLFRGPVLNDIDQGRFLQDAVADLEASRLATLQLFFDTQLRRGRHREILSELASLLVLHRFSEELHAQFMLALYRAGHRFRALSVFAALKHRLAEEFGVEPSVTLLRLQEAIRHSDRSLELAVW